MHLSEKATNDEFNELASGPAWEGEEGGGEEGGEIVLQWQKRLLANAFTLNEEKINLFSNIW